jgi:glycerol kinase
LFAGNEHEKQIKRIAEHFGVPVATISAVRYRNEVVESLSASSPGAAKAITDLPLPKESEFNRRSLSEFKDYITAYHQLMCDIMEVQVAYTKLVIGSNPLSGIYVDGGFSKNDIYMKLLAKSFPGYVVAAATVAQSTALGAALAIHQHWNELAIPGDLIELKLYSSP